MAIIPLRVYNHEIEGMIDNRQLDEAVAHCRHILATFPKHIATYRLLGKAHLEQQRISDATDIFQRVLTSVPDDFIANVGMSIIREDENNLDASIWHMELAYEAQPANAAIQDELRRLYGRRDGVQPPKVRLTRGALARMYSKGGLYDQAVAELRLAIAEEPNRPDLQLLLAEMFFQTNQRVEAVETCANIVKKIPLCLEANRILAVSLPETEGSDAIKNYRQIVISLDPYYAFAGPEAISSDQVPENAVNIERLDYKSGIQVTEAPIQPNWATSLGISIDKPEDENLPEWLKAAEAAPQPSTPAEQGTSSVSPFIWDTQEVTNIINESTKSESQLPDWMKDAGWQSSSGAETPPPVKESPVEPIQENPASGEPEKAEIPDWLQGIAPEVAGREEKPSTDSTESNLSTPWLEQHQPGPSDSIIHWLEDNKPDTPPNQPAREEAAAPLSEDEMPDWLKDLEPTENSPAVPGQTNIPAPAFSIEPDAFLEEPSESEKIKASDVPIELPPEVSQTPTEGIQPSETEEALPGMPLSVEADAETAEEVPDWLKELAEEPAAAEETPILGESGAAEEPVTPDTQTPETAAAEQSPLIVGESPAESMPVPAEMTTAPEELPAMLEEKTHDEVPQAEVASVSEGIISGESEATPEEVPMRDAAPEEVPSGEAAPATAEEPLVEMPLPLEQTPEPEALKLTEELPTIEQPGQIEEVPAEESYKEGEEPTQVETTLPVEAEMPVEERKPAEEENALAWLEDIAAEHSTKLENVPATPEGGEILPPEWVKLEAEPPLDEFTTQESKAMEATAIPAEEIPNWIKGLGEEHEAKPPAEEPETMPEIEMTPSEELPAWLQELEQPEAEKGTAAPSEEALEWKAEEMPDWLKEISETEPSVGQPAPAETPAPEAVAPGVVLSPVEVPPVEMQPSEESTQMEIPPITAVAPAEDIEKLVFTPIEETTPTEVPEAAQEGITTEAAPLEVPEIAEAPVAAEVAPEEAPEIPVASMEAPVAAEVAPEEAPEILEAPIAAEVAPIQVPEVPEAPITEEVAAIQLPEVPEAPVAAEVAPEEAPETLEAPVTAEVAPEEVPETLEVPIAAEVAAVQLPEVPEAPVSEEVAPLEAPKFIEAPVVAEAAPVEAPEALEAPIEQTVPPSIVEPAPEWSSEATPPAGIKRSALEETPMEPAVSAPAFKEVIQPEPALPISPTEPVSEEGTPIMAEATVKADEVSLDAFKAASTANQTAFAEAQNAMVQGQPSPAIEIFQGLIKQRYHLPEIIKELQEALYRFPVNIDMWVTLGDAHLHEDDLSEALSAYTKAEELVR